MLKPAAFPKHVPNTTSGWKQLAHTLKASDVQRVGIEATGGYERGVMRHPRRHEIAVILPQLTMLTPMLAQPRFGGCLFAIA